MNRAKFTWAKSEHSMTKSIILFAALTFLFGAMFYTAWLSYEASITAQSVSKTIAEKMTIKSHVIEKIPGWGDDANILKMNQTRNEQASFQYGSYFLGWSFLAIILSLVFGRKSSVLPLTLLGISLIALTVGITAPAMTMVAQKNIKFVGDLVLYYESRGIIDTIIALLGPKGSWLIGFPLLLFSVVLPLVKTGALIVAMLRPTKDLEKILAFVHKVGKWSMADVFVVSLLLSFFAAGHDGFIEAKLMVGIYFFAYYAILSILGATLVNSQFAKTLKLVVTPEE
jgi:paraquat-inducible protein A